MGKKTEERCDLLHSLGLKFNGEYYQYRDETVMIAFHTMDITMDSDIKFEREVNKVKKGLEDRGIKRFGDEYDKEAYIKAREDEHRAWEEKNKSWLQPEDVGQDEDI